jgi:hypothetical protein
LAEGAVASEPFSAYISLLTGKNTGNMAVAGWDCWDKSEPNMKLGA